MSTLQDSHAAFKLLILAGLSLAYGAAANADTVAVTFLGVNTGVNNGAYYVMPYQIYANGVDLDAVCYDIFDDVNVSQTWK
jgi:hypothetical protein